MKIWPKAKLKYVARFAYGDALPPDRESSGEVPVYGSNGPYAVHSISNTAAPALVIGRKGSYGKVNWSSTACFASDTTFYVDETVTQHDLRWIYWLLQTLRLDEGSDEAAVPGLNRESAYEMTVSVPSIPEQRAIADYLDRETGRLDALVAAKERVLELLAEKRRALITRAVTRGLNPNAPLRDFGLPWLGQIPKHWCVERLKFHLCGLEQGWSPQCDNVPADADEWGVLKAGCVNAWNFNADENKRLPNDLQPPQEYIIKTGDVLMSRANTTELLGSTALVRTVRSKLLLCDKLYRLNLNEERLDKEFLVAFLRCSSGRFVFERDATGASASMQNIGMDSVRNVWLPVPPLSEQRAIVAHIERETGKLDALRSATERTVALLKERRAALIAAAVTGQIDSADSGKLM